MSLTKIAGAALNQTPLDWENNLSNIKTAIEKAKRERVDILCLPELAITGYGCEDLFLSEWLPQKAVAQLDEIKKWCSDITVAVGLPVRKDHQTFNTACVIKNQKILGFTAKQLLANEGVHYEPRWFTPWEGGKESTIKIAGKSYPFGDIIYTIDGIKTGIEICEDAWHEDKRPAIRFAKNDVKLILSPSASHFAFGKHLFRQNLVLKSAKKYNCTYVYSNLLGNEAGRMIYDGDIIISQNNRLLAYANRLTFKDVNVKSTFVDLDNPKDTPTTKIKRLTTYLKETEFLFAEALALYDYMRKSKSGGFVVSLSGGADSATCAVLVHLMVKGGIHSLGIDKFIEKAGILNRTEIDIFRKLNKDGDIVQPLVEKILTCAYQGTKNSSQETLKAAQTLAKELGATFHHWTIDDEVGSGIGKIEQAIGRKLTWEQDDITLQNIQARIRSPFIWMLANIKNALLLATSNRSEGDVGYATMDGDTSGSISPIAGVDKHFIREWLKWAEEKQQIRSLKLVNALQPSAELRPLEKVQTDEDDLMPYDTMVAIERLAIGERKSPVEVFKALEKGFEKELLKKHITKFFQLWSRNQWKRERIAPSFHLDSFNVDPRSWCRFPILSSSFKDELKALNNL